MKKHLQEVHRICQCEIMFGKGLVLDAQLWYTIRNETDHRRAL